MLLLLLLLLFFFFFTDLLLTFWLFWVLVCSEGFSQLWRVGSTLGCKAQLLTAMAALVSSMGSGPSGLQQLRLLGSRAQAR